MIKNKNLWIVLVMLLASSSLVIWWRQQHTKSKRLAAEAEARAFDTKGFSMLYRGRRTPEGWAPFESGLIGGLTITKETAEVDKGLENLAPGQASSLKKLDALVREAIDNARRATADYMDTNPPDYKEVHVRLQSRLGKTRRHAERMAALGLLTEPQADFVMQKFLKTRSVLSSLQNENVQHLLGMKVDQKEELLRVLKAAEHRYGSLKGDTIEVGKQYATIQQETEAAAMKILTPSQQDTWSRLTAARPEPAKPLDLPALSQAEAARIKIEDASPVFRVLTEKADAFDLSDTQTKLLHRLEEITRQGLYWIGLRKDAPAAGVSQVRAEFVKQAEQVALFGILTHEQAKEVESAVK